MMDTKKKGLDREMILVCGLAAMLASVAIVFGFVLLFWLGSGKV